MTDVSALLTEMTAFMTRAAGVDQFIHQLRELDSREAVLLAELTQLRERRLSILTSPVVRDALATSGQAEPPAPVPHVSPAPELAPEVLATSQRTCVECGGSFRSSNPRRKLCSESCSVKRRHRQTDEWWAKRKEEAKRAAETAETPKPEPPPPAPACAPAAEPLRTVEDQMRAAVSAGAVDPDPRPQPERRCSRCCSRYRPAGANDYYCARCRANGAGAHR